ncbi:flavin reductase family protein [Streptomyces siamensis]|uniref:Flavin reductase like domain-containing protein n=1 Tax=Streptomyces siamensis TaxID=1274986 RepID=A0ABP9JCY2_9ACTN
MEAPHLLQRPTPEPYASDVPAPGSRGPEAHAPEPYAPDMRGPEAHVSGERSPARGVPDAVRPHRQAMDQREFRNILGRFTTGVVLVTAQTADGPAGMAVNSFTSVSLDPPLVALCAAHTSTTWPAVRAAGSFAVTILGGRHAELCRLFSERGADRFAGRDWARSPAGHPIPADGLAWLECRPSVIHPAGDHELVIAAVDGGALSDAADPLVFHAGRLRGLAA